MLLQQRLQFVAPLGHDVEQVARNRASIAEGEEPDFATDRASKALCPHLSNSLAALHVVPIRKDLFFPDFLGAFKSLLLLEPLSAFSFNCADFLFLTFKVFESVFAWQFVTLVNYRAGLLNHGFVLSF